MESKEGLVDTYPFEISLDDLRQQSSVVDSIGHLDFVVPSSLIRRRCGRLSLPAGSSRAPSRSGRRCSWSKGEIAEEEGEEGELEGRQIRPVYILHLRPPKLDPYPESYALFFSLHRLATSPSISKFPSEIRLSEQFPDLMAR
ncbi:hypothetical protein Dimus_014939 [Dionaea muscipula]